MDAGRYGLALDEARRALDRQADEVSSIRVRTTALVSVGALAAAFIGGLAVRDEAPLTVWTSLGAVSFALLLVVAVAALWPRNLTFAQRADDLVVWADECDDPDDMTRDLALHMRKHYLANAEHLTKLTRLYVGGLVLLLVEILLLLVDLRGR